MDCLPGRRPWRRYVAIDDPDAPSRATRNLLRAGLRVTGYAVLIAVTIALVVFATRMWRAYLRDSWNMPRS